jgi:hypothetical protein
MTSNYPPPPSTIDDVKPVVETAQQGSAADSQHAQVHPTFNAEISAAAAIATAHHGLQALQAAVAVPGSVSSQSTVTSQHAPIVDGSYLGGAPAAAAQGGAAPNHNPKATRLRRACDMCSQRKVKVRPPRSAFV